MPIHTWRTPTLTITHSRAGWTGDSQFELDHDLPLGAEIQLITQSGDTLWLGHLVDKTSASNTRLRRYRARGICEHFLELPFPYTDLNQQAQRTNNASSLWEHHLARYLRQHTPRYSPIYDLTLFTIDTHDIRFGRVRDLYKLFQTLRPCRIAPEILPGGRIRMRLEELPSTPYHLPRNATWELTESIRETATRLSLANPANQLIPDRRIADPEYWQLVVPSGATASITPLDPNYYGYLGADATRVDVEITFMVWVGIQLRQPIRAPKTPTGAYAPLVVGYYARGDNARVRLRVGDAISPDEVYNDIDAGYTETSYIITPTTDELSLTIEIQPATPTLPATLVLDGVYALPGDQPLSERNYPPHNPITAQIPSFLTAGIIAVIDTVVSQGGGIYDLVVRWAPFPLDIPENTPIQILESAGYLTGRVVQVNNPTVLRVQIDGPYTPRSGDILYVMHGAGDYAERDFDTRYVDLEAPIHLYPNQLAAIIERFAKPSATLTAQLPPTFPIPQIGQFVPHPEHPRVFELLTISEVQLAITHGQLSGIQLKAGTPEPTLRALMRKLSALKPREV